MTDRELLELAARAEGHAYPWVLPARGGERPWNPLTDDGDALRLAVTLGLTIITEPFFVRVHSIRDAFLVREEVVLDGFAATRRAIVRAAAALADPNPSQDTSK